MRILGDRPLLTREQEVALAERIDYGTRAVRAALQDAVLIARRLGWSGQIRKAAEQLHEIGEANGLPAPVIDKAEPAPSSCLQKLESRLALLTSGSLNNAVNRCADHA